MIMVGFASNIWVAVVGKALGGFLNGNIGVIQTMVGELVTKPEHEPQAYSVMPFVWPIGTVLGLAIGGTFADSVVNFPRLFSPTGLFAKFPYLLPNLFCTFLLFVSIAFGYLFLEETHLDIQPRVLLPGSTYYSEETPLIATADAIKAPAVDLRIEIYGTFEGSDDHGWRTQTPCKTPISLPKVFTKQTLALILAMGIFAYHCTTYDHLLPIFLEDERASPKSMLSALNSFTSDRGLGLSLRTVGLIMSVNGVLALVIQVIVFPICASYFGIHRLFVVVSVLHPVAYFIVPYILLIPSQSALLFPAIYACLLSHNLLAIIAYPIILIIIKEATPSPIVLGRVNGLAASVGAASRTIAPPIAGYLYTIGSQMDFTGLAWWGSGLVAAIGTCQCFWAKREKRARDLEEEKREVMRISLQEVNGVKA